MNLFQRILPLGAVVLASSTMAPVIQAQEALAGLCARVRIEIPQELTLERIGFEATLEVTNNDGEDPLTEFSARMFFMDPDKDPSDPEYDATDKFFVQPPTLENINRIDGSGVIGPTKKATVRWFIIPKIQAGGEDPRGKPYLVSCELSANIRGTEVPSDALLVMPESITVKPDAQLDIVYFQPQYVTGDDPFTAEVESSIPFKLGVLVRNRGFGPANKLKIASQQPRIQENLQGLLLVARLLGVRVMDQPLNEASLTVDLGDLPPGGTRKGAWEMITSLSGIFTEFKASYRHAPDLGGEETSVITSIAAHFITGEVLNDEPGRDNILDFLADTNRDGMPDTLFETQGQELPVNILQQVMMSPLSGNSLQIDLTADIEGWGYFRLEDPAQGKLDLQRVVRSDGKVLSPHNAWLEERYTPGRSERDYFFHVLDRVELGNYSYTATYVPPPLDVTAPVTRLRFSGEVSESGGQFFITPETQVFFTSEDESPVSIVYKLNEGQFRPALPFTIREPGVYQLTYYATDAANNVEAEKTAVLVLGQGGPGIDEVQVVSDGLYLRGESLSVRTGEVQLLTDVAPNPLEVGATVTVFDGTRAFPWISGVPPTPSSLTEVSLQVGGDHVDYYRYRLNGGAWSGDRAVHLPIELAGLGSTVTLEVLGRPNVGMYPPYSDALTVTWQVFEGEPAWQLQDAPTIPTRDMTVALTVSRPSTDLYRWMIDSSYFRAEEPLSTPVLVDRLLPGEHSLSFLGRFAGIWEDEFEPTDIAKYTWLIDTDYGSNFDGLTVVNRQAFASVQGTTFSYSWNGRDDAGKLQQPGWYTVLTELTDSLGNRYFRSHLVQVSDLAGEQQTLVSSAGSPRNPYGRGDWAVWQQRSGGSAWQVYAQEVADSASSPIALTTGSLSQENPRTDGRYVVWQARQLNGSSDILMVDLEAPEVVMTITASPDHNEINPAVSWPWVVYQKRPVADANAPWQLEVFNVLTNTRDWVYPGQDDQTNPSMDAGRVVWRDLRDPGNGEIYFQNLETAETMRLTEDLFGQFVPNIRGNWVAWQDNRDGQVEIYGFHLHDRRDVRLSSGVGNKARPFIEGDWMVFEEDSYAFETANIHLLNLESGQSVPLTYDSANKSRPALVGGKLLWQQGTAEPFALRASSLPALQAAFPSSNAVAVTQGMVDRYGDAFSLLADWQTNAGVAGLRRFTALVPALVAEEAIWAAGAASGVNFALQAGSFIWVEFPDRQVLDLGDRIMGAIDLQSGINVISYDQFPFDYTAHRMIADLGVGIIRGLRMLDAATGIWRSVEVGAGAELLGPDFIIPPVAVVIVDLSQPLSGWSPR